MDHFPKFGGIGIQHVIGYREPVGPRTFKRFPGITASRSYGRKGAATLSYRQGAAALADIVEQREAFCLEFGHGHHTVRHRIMIAGFRPVR
jgi:hypothetical protein